MPQVKAAAADSPAIGGSDRRGLRLAEGVRLGLAVVLAAVMSLAVLVVVTRPSDDTDDEAAAPADAADADAGGESDPLLSPCPSDTPAEVCDAVAFVETFKQRPFQEFPEVNFIDDEAFDEFLFADFDEGVAELAELGDVLRSLGLIEPEVDLVEALATSLELGVIGAYDTEDAELNVRGTQIDLSTRSTMVHELAHAWDDQWFELARPELDDVDDESAVAFLHLVEGSAVLVEQAWRGTLSDDERRELERLELSMLTPGELSILLSLPEFLLQTQISPYVDGAAFVAEFYDEGGIDAVNALFDNPPITTEQVLHPERFRAGEGPIEVPIPDAQGEVISEGMIGALAIDLWLGQQAGDGWGGDAYVAWSEGGATCTAATIVGDTPQDTNEVLEAARRWAAGTVGRSAQLVDGVVGLLGCR